MEHLTSLASGSSQERTALFVDQLGRARLGNQSAAGKLLIKTSSGLRGAGPTIEGPTQRSYLEMVASRLPKGVAPLAGFYLRTMP